jgi:hypothetical protein
VQLRTRGSGVGPRGVQRAGDLRPGGHQMLDGRSVSGCGAGTRRRTPL